MLRAGAAAMAAIAVFASCHGLAQEKQQAFAERTLPTLYVHDSFEDKELSQAWAHDRFEAGAVVLQSKVVRAGKQAVAITVHSHDKFGVGTNGDNDTERDEIREDDSLFARENVPYETSFSMYFPADFPIVPVRLVIAQWKQFCREGVAACGGKSPVLALRYIDGELQVTQDLADVRHVIYRQKAEFRGRWLDFRLRYRFTPGADGHVAVWLGKKQLIDLHGVTADAEGPGSGYEPEGANHFYFKMGLYRDVMPQPMTVYIDEYTKRQLTAGEF